jgi:hypothetical protein
MAEISAGQLKVLEKLIGDEEFRTSFYEDPDAAIAKAGINLTEEELVGIKGIDINTINSVIADIDVRISKTDALGALTGNITGATPTGFF